MAYGPVEFIVLKFPGNHFTGEIVPALDELIESGTVRIIDLMFVMKDADGALVVVEPDAAGDLVASSFAPFAEHEDELLSESDARHFGELLEPDSSAAMILFENTWATRFASAVRNANGEVLFNERVPRAVIDDVIAELTGSAS
ncbi:hypothetical protein BH23CHL5_BH23CHL5_13260 [soil metagenome]